MDTPDQHGALTPLAREPGVVASAAYVAGQRVAELPIESAAEWLKKPGT